MGEVARVDATWADEQGTVHESLDIGGCVGVIDTRSMAENIYPMRSL